MSAILKNTHQLFWSECRNWWVDWNGNIQTRFLCEEVWRLLRKLGSSSWRRIRVQTQVGESCWPVWCISVERGRYCWPLTSKDFTHMHSVLKDRRKDLLSSDRKKEILKWFISSRTWNPMCCGVWRRSKRNEETCEIANIMYCIPVCSYKHKHHRSLCNCKD